MHEPADEPDVVLDDELDDTQEEPEPRPWWRRWGPGLLQAGGVAVAAIVLMTLVGWIRGPFLPPEAPAFNLRDLDGEAVALSDFRGQAVLLNFWATWCGPCRAEAPALSRFDQRHPDILVLGIAADGSPAQLRRSAEDLGITYRILRADRATLDRYKVSSFPTTVLVTEEGRVATTYTGMMMDPQLELLRWSL